jgi:hypothetical protein
VVGGAHPKVVMERTGSMPLQYAGPKPAELLQLHLTALSTGQLGAAADDDWEEDWEDWDDDDDE